MYGTLEIIFFNFLAKKLYWAILTIFKRLNIFDSGLSRLGSLLVGVHGFNGYTILIPIPEYPLQSQKDSWNLHF